MATKKFPKRGRKAILDNKTVFSLRWSDVHSYSEEYLKDLQENHPEEFKWLSDFEALEMYGHHGPHNDTMEDNVLADHYSQEDTRRVWREEYRRKVDCMRLEHIPISKIGDNYRPDYLADYESWRNVEEDKRIDAIDKSREEERCSSD